MEFGAILGVVGIDLGALEFMVHLGQMRFGKFPQAEISRKYVGVLEMRPEPQERGGEAPGGICRFAVAFQQGVGQRRWRELKLRRAEIDTDSAEGRAEFHRLRIQIKNFRYVLHCLAGLWPAKDSKGLMKVLSHLQESSGLIRDAQMAASHLLPLGLEAPSELALHAGVLWGYLVARKQREAKKFRKSWARFLEVSRPWD